MEAWVYNFPFVSNIIRCRSEAIQVTFYIICKRLVPEMAERAEYWAKAKDFSFIQIFLLPPMHVYQNHDILLLWIINKYQSARQIKVNIVNKVRDPKKLDKNMIPPLSLPNGTDFSLKLYVKHILAVKEWF